MMAFTNDGQADPAMVMKRDNRFRVSSLEKRENRADISAGPADPAADSWQQGKIIQFRAVEIHDDGSSSVQESHHASNPGEKYVRPSAHGEPLTLLTTPFNRRLKLGNHPTRIGLQVLQNANGSPL